MADTKKPQTQRQMPNRIYIHNESGQPHDTTIHDAETGEQIEGVMEVTITPKSVDVLVTPHWPDWKQDITVNSPPDYDGESREGVNVERHRYPLKRLEAESW